MFTVRDGLVTAFEEVVDTGALVEAFAPADPARGRAFFTTCAGCHGIDAQGDAAAGGAVYAARCASCHGLAGEGMATLDAPALAGLQDWYQLAQMQAFRTGMRGAHADDVPGARMRPAAVELGDGADLQDVVAWLATLGRAAGP